MFDDGDYQVKTRETKSLLSSGTMPAFNLDTKKLSGF